MRTGSFSFGRKSAWYAMAMIMTAFLVAGFLRLNDLCLYSPDSIRYVIWGNSLAEGKGFTDDTQPDPQQFVEHAPLYSVLIAPVEFFFPRSLLAVKIMTVCWGALALLLFYLWLSRRLGPKMALAGALLMVCNPLLLVYSSESLSEAPFVAFMCGALILAERVVEEKDRAGFGWLLLVMIVGTIGLLREIGVVVALSVILFFLCHRQFRRAGILFLAAAGCLGLWYVRNQLLVPLPEGSAQANSALVFQHFVTPAETPILFELAQRIWLSIAAYAWQLGGMLLYPVHGSGQVHLALSASDMPLFARILIFALVASLTAAGVASDWRERAGAIFRGAMLAAYLLAVFVYPVHDIRFLFPILPLMIYYLLRGGGVLADRIPALRAFGRARIAVPLLLLVMLPNLLLMADILGTNASYQASPTGFYRELVKLRSFPTIYTYPWSLVGRWVRDSVPEGSVIASPAKILAIMVDRQKVLEANPGLTLPLFEKMIRDYNVAYLVSKTRWQDYRLYEFLMSESKRYRFDPVYAAGNLHLYKVTSLLRSPAAGPKPAFPPLPADSVSVAGLLRLGRSRFLHDDFQGAIRCFLRASEKDPDQPDVVYESIAAYSMEGNSSEAQRSYQRLMSFPQAASQLYLARVHINAMQVALSAGGVAATQERAIKMNDLARLYWDMGYRTRAERLADVSLRLDSAYFWGLLWGFHFNLQNGDSADARHYYRQLAAMSEQNPVVVSFRRLLAIGDSLQWVRDPGLRSGLHVSAGRLYQLIELYETSLDEGERALGDDPGNGAAMLLLGEVFERTGSLRMAENYLTALLAQEPGNSVVRAKSDSLRAVLSAR